MLDLSNQPVRAVPKEQAKQKRRNLQTIKRRLRKQVARRDGDWCLLCGRPPGGLQLHRVIYGSEGGQYVLDNVVQLCIHCHTPIVHANKRLWQPRLIRYLQTLDKWEVAL